MDKKGMKKMGVCDDLISRKAAIDALIAEGRNVDSRYLESERIIHESDAVEAISLLPSAPRWIPVSERLPEEDKVEERDVLCFTIHQTMLVASYGKLYPLSDEVGWITNEYNRLHVSSVLAWMPLPKPWKGE